MRRRGPRLFGSRGRGGSESQPAGAGLPGAAFPAAVAILTLLAFLPAPRRRSQAPDVTLGAPLPS